MNTRNRNLLIASAALAAGAAAVYYARNRNHAPLEVASNVDLDKYLGEWYEIARLPASFEKNCYATKARYSRLEDGSIEVVNTCHKGSVDGELKVIKGKAFVADPETNAKLKVQFFWPIRGDYWILEVGDNYEYALVGEPSRENLWILSRTASIDLMVLQGLLRKAQELGFDTEQLVYTEQMK